MNLLNIFERIYLKNCFHCQKAAERKLIAKKTLQTEMYLYKKVVNSPMTQAAVSNT